MILDATDPQNATKYRASCVDMLSKGGLVGMPTETVYGLAADACNDAAVAQIFAAKGRPSEHPLIVHVADSDTVNRFASAVPEFAKKLMHAFWPGPLTLILLRQPDVAAACAGGQDSIGVRCPAHPVTLALLNVCSKQGIYGLAAPSANLFGRVSPTTAAHVQSEFANTAYSDMPILDGGACSVGIESTIIDCTRGAPVLLRPGMLTRIQLEHACGQSVLLNNEHPRQLTQDTETNFVHENVAPRASGTLESHYAPNATVRLMDSKSLQSALDILGENDQHIAVYSRQPMQSGAKKIRFRTMPNDATQAAQQLFATLRELDQPNIKLIWVETPPDDATWDGVRDRLMRAAA